MSDKRVNAVTDRSVGRNGADPDRSDPAGDVRGVLVDGINALLFVLDPHLRFTYLNRQSQTLLGREPGGLIGRRLEDLIHPDDRGELRAGSRRLQEEGLEATGATVRLEQSDGGWRRFALHMSAERDDAGEIIACHGLAAPVDLEEPSRRVREVEVRYKELIDKARDAVYISSREGRIIDINPAGLELFGYDSLEEMKELYIPEDIYADEGDRSRLIAAMERQGFVQNMELTFKRKDNTPINILLTSNARRDADGRVIGYEGFVRDVTDLKSMQAALEETNQRLGEMVRRLSLYNKITEVSHKIEDFDELLTEITSLTREGLETDRDYVILSVLGSDGVDERIAFTGPRKENVARELLAGLGSPTEMMGRSIRLHELPQTAGIRDHKLNKALSGEIVYRGKPSGLFAILSAREGPFRDSELAMVEEMVDRLPAIIHHRLLVEHLKLRTSELQEKINRLSLISEMARLWGTHLDLDQILHMILVSVTAGPGLGFNRAFLFLVDRDKGTLEGKMAIGPADSHEAGRIWTEIDRKKLSLAEMMESYHSSHESANIAVNRIVRDISIDLKSKDNFFVDMILKGEPCNVVDARSDPLMPEGFAGRIGTGAFACVPLVVRGEVLGTLMVDNLITSRPIRDADLDQLWIFASHAAQAIMNSQLYQRLSDRMGDLRKAYRELKENRGRLVRAERLSAVGEVATDVAHEIRNPLASIGGFARGLRKHFQEGTTQYKHLNIIIDEVVRLEKFLSEVLEYARPATSRPDLADLNDLIEQTFQMMEGDIDRDRHIVRTDLDQALPPIWVDPDQIRQVLLNVFTNAVQAMPDGGELSVSTGVSGDLVQARISDTGIGIEPEHMDNLFSPFFTTRSSGSGLGLTISLQIVRSHGGSIGVESERGSGTTFVISLPIKKDAAAGGGRNR